MPARFNQFTTSIFKRKNHADSVENEVFDPVSGNSIPSAKNCVEQFLNELTSLSVSQSTLRNYSSDILQFIEFSKDNDVRTVLSGKNFQAFFADQQHKGLKSSSIQRKIVSLKLFSQWVEKNVLSTQVSNQEQVIPHVQPQIHVQEQPLVYAAVEPISPQITPPLDSPESETIETFVNPEVVTPPPTPSENKKGYRGWILGPYFHLATLVIFFIFISILWYRQFFVTVPQDLAYPSSPVTPERILSFQARLTDVAGSPITTPTNTTFRLYSDPTAGSLLWNSGTCSIDPDQDGIFSTILGSTCGSAIDSSVFTENSQVWLEITVVSDILTPRQRIATVPYALNSETIQGYPINSTGSATRNTVLVMNQWGEVLLGEQSPRLRSVSGTFSISGSTLSLVTNSGSNGNITLDPDGTGLINLIGNINNDGYIFTHGATISATYAGNTPLTINGTGGQVLTVNNVGDVTTAGDLAVNGGDITSTGDITFSPAGNNILFSDNTVLNIGGAGATAYNFFADSTAGNNTASGDNDLYIQDILEVDGAARFDSSVTLSTLNTAGGVVYTNGSGQLLVSSAGSGGDCLLSGGTGSPTWGTCSSGGLAGTWRIANGAHSPVNDTLDLLVGSNASSSAKFAVLNVNSGTPTASLSAGAAGGAYLTATGALQTTANQTLTLGGSTTGDIALSPLNSTGGVDVNLGAARLLNVLTGNLKVGNGVPTVALDGEDAYIEGTLEVDGAVRFDSATITMSTFSANGGLLYTNASGVLIQTTTGTSGQCLKSNGGGAPTFGTCATDNYWRLATGAISPVNDTLDLLVGSTASSSAKFAVLNVNSGTPTASLSAGAAGGSYLSADGVLQTTANQTLTLGGLTTGDIAISPQNSTGGVNFNLGAARSLNILTGNLKVGNGTPDVTQNGEDAYIEGTLEVDGAVRFDSSLTVTTLNNAGGIIYANGSGQLLVSGAGSSGDCLQSGGTGAPTWSTCGSGGLAGTWRISNGAHSPVNDTLDLLVGSNATSSAKFAVLNVNSGTPTASLSAGAAGGAYLSADGVLQTTANQSLTLGGSTTGDINLSPQNSSGGVNVNLGATRTLNVLTGNLAVGNGVPTLALDGEDAYIEGTLEVDGAVLFDNSSITFSSFTTDGGLLYTNGSGVLAQTGQGTAGQCLKSNAGGAPTFGDCATDNYWRLANGALSPINDTLDLLVGSNATSSAKFAVLNVNSGTPVASLSAGAAGGSYLSADGILQTTANQTLTLGGITTGDIEVSPLNSTGGVNVNLGATRLLNILTGNLKVGNGVPTLALDGEDAYIEGTLEVDGAVRFDSSLTVTTLNNAGGIIYANGSGQLLVSSAGSSGDCLQSGGTGAPVWSTCGSGGLAGTWRIGNGAHSPVNDTLDLLIGSNASASARFAVLNVNSGTPTASLSAGAAGGSYLSADGVLQTTANQTLTLGGSTTGDISISPQNSTGGVDINLGAARLLNVLTGNLKVGNAAPTVALDGEDAFIEGTLEVDGAVRFDNSSITFSNFTTDGGLLYTNGSGVIAQTAQGTAGQCLKSNAGGAPSFGTCATDNYWRIATGVISPVNDTLDLLVGSNASASAKFAVLNVNSGTPIASLSAGATGGSYLSADGGLQTTANQTLTLGGSTTGDIAISPLNSAGGVNVNLGAARLLNVLTGNLKVGNAAPTVALDGEDAFIEGTLEVDGAIRFDNSSITLSSFTTDGGLLYTNGSGVVAQTAQGTAGQCLKSNAGGAPTFSTCATDNYWRIATGAISPTNDTLDFLIGANATSSAKFAVLNVNTGTPTASLSAGAAGGAYLNASGTLQTTANQTLTLGGSTTGDIAISPLNSTGGVDVNLGAARLLNILTGNLKVGNAAPTVALDGEDAFIEGTLEVDGAIRFDNSAITFSSFTTNGGLLYTNGSGVVAQTATGSLGECLTSNGGSAPSWTSCSASSGNLWRVSGGTISPINDTLDFLVGANATSSAKFAVLNVNSGTPTASLSAGAAGGSYLNATGTLQTTANQTLTLGGSTTGDIEVSPLNSTGGVNINLGAARLLNVLTGNLKVGNAAPTVALDGEDAFIEGTLEVDGAVRFDNSAITLSSFTANGGLLYTNGSGVLAQTAVGSSGQCLTSIGGGAPAWANCSSASSNYWRLATGAVSPVNDTLDLLIGSNATSSARFAVLNVNSGTPTASLSAGAAGGAYLNATGALQTTANQTLTLGGSTTGDIAISPLNSAGGVNVNLGASRTLNVLTGNLAVGNGVPTVTLNGEDAYIEGTFEVDGAVRFDNSSITLSTFSGNGGLLYTNGSGVVAQTAVGSSGQCLTSIGGGAPAWANCSAASSNYWRLATGALSPVNNTLDLLVGSNATSSARFAVLNVNTGTPIASLSAGAAGGSYLSATGALQTTANQTLTLGGSTTGDIAISPLNSAGGVNVNLGAARTLNVLTGNLAVGNGVPTVALDGEDAYIEGTFEVDGAVRFDNSSITLSSFTANGGLLYTNGSGVLAQTAVGNSGECLTSIGGGSPAWANCSAASGNLWRLANGAVSPVNNTLDLLVGSNATSSARFAVLNVNSGTPIASLSAGATGGAYFSAAGALQTTANQTLAIGGSTTGNITMSPLNGQGGVTITSNLSAAGRTTDLVTLTQANDGSNNSTGNLLQLTNLDTGSTAAILSLDQQGVGGTGIQIDNDGTGTGIDLSGMSISSGNGIALTGSAITSGNAISLVSNTSSVALSNFSGKLINATIGRTYTGNSTVTDSGNHLLLARTTTQNTGTGTFNVTGDVARFTSTCSASGGTCTDSSHILTLQQNYASATGSVLDVTNAGTGVGILLTSSSTGDLMQLDATGAGTTANGLLIRQAGAGTITDAIDVSDEVITNALNVGANTITGAGYLITSTSGGLIINSTSADLALNTTTSGNITSTPGTAAGLFNVLTGNLKVGNGTPTVTLDGEDAYIEGTFEVDGAVRFDNSSLTLSTFTTNGGLLYTNGSGVVSSTAAGSSGECLKSNGGGAPTFQTCGGGAGSNWRITTGAISPINDTLDLLIGNTATTSAKFAVLNVNSGTPTASLSAGAAGGAYLNATGTLQTTANQNLTLGGSTTGNITLSPKNGAGLLTFNEDSLTTTTGLNLTADALTSGTAFYGQSTSTALTTGRLLSFDWSPTGSTEIFAGSGSALLNLNIGTYGNIDKILNIQDDGSTVFSVSQSKITSALPHEFTAAGDVSIAYDIQFTNQTASYIKSNAPLYIEAGESFENNNLTLRTYGTGKIIADGGFSLNTQETLTDSTTPDVSGASNFIEANGTNRLVTNFTGGTAGQIIVIEQTTSNLDFDCTSNANFNCGNADITAAAGSVYAWISDGTQWNMISHMNAGTASGNDLAEFFPSSESLQAGDVITVDTSNPVTIKKETKSASESVIGIISTQPGITLGDETPSSYKVALAGRVPVKVDPNSPQIRAGEHITSSSTPGTARLAEQAGMTIGVALEDWIPGSGDSDVMVFVNRTWYEPKALQLTLNTDGSLASNYTIQAPTQSQNGRFTIISNASTQVMQQLSILAQLVVGEIQAGLIRSQQLIADTITVNQKLTSPEIETNSLKTSLISPLANGGLTFKLGADQNSNLAVKNASDKTLLSVDQNGNTAIAGNLEVAQDATVAGQVTANSGRFEQLLAQKATLENTDIKTATITGQLYLADGRSIQSIIDDNDGYLASISAQAEQITQQIQSTPQALSSSSFADFLSQLTGSQDASVSAAIEALAQQQNITLQSTDMVLAPDAIFVKEYLNVAGFAQFNNANVSSSLTIGNNLILTQDSIASLNQTLFIQPTATSSVNILAGLLVLNPDGNVELNGNLFVSGDVNVGQKLNTNSIQPNDYSSDVTLKLATQSAVLGADTQSKFSILDANNSNVASIDASGSARFNELSAQGLVIQNPTATATDSATLTENQKYQTIGSSTLPAGTTEFTIENYNVNENVLINLTPTSDTANQVLFVKSKETCSGPVQFTSCKKSFTVGIKNAVTQNISFNYWIVKVQ